MNVKTFLAAAGLVFFAAASRASGPGEGVRTARVRREASIRVLRASGAVEGDAARRGKRIRARADFPMEWAALIAPGMPVEGRLHPSNPGTFAGKTLSVDKGEGSGSTALRVRVELRDPKGRLKPGDYLELLLRVPRRRLCVPPGAAVYPPRSPEVFVVSGSGRFEPRAVEVGAAEGDCLEILSGLREGEAVAASGAEVSGP